MKCRLCKEVEAPEPESERICEACRDIANQFIKENALLDVGLDEILDKIEELDNAEINETIH